MSQHQFHLLCNQQVLFEVFKFIHPSSKTFIQFGSVCKDWLSVMSSNYLWFREAKRIISNSLALFTDIRLVAQLGRETKRSNIKHSSSKKKLEDLIGQFDNGMDWRNVVKQIETKHFIFAYLQQLIQTAVINMDQSGYITRGSTWGFATRKSLFDFSLLRASLRKGTTDRQEYGEITTLLNEFLQGLHIESLKYVAYYDKFHAKHELKQPITWLCSYEHPIRKRIVWGCIKRLHKIMSHTRQFGKLDSFSCSALLSSGFTHVFDIFVNDEFAIVFGRTYGH